MEHLDVRICTTVQPRACLTAANRAATVAQSIAAQHAIFIVKFVAAGLHYAHGSSALAASRSTSSTARDDPAERRSHPRGRRQAGDFGVASGQPG